jgi:dipeptidyl aminopeptidase/acylaminoacyl peptidase
MIGARRLVLVWATIALLAGGCGGPTPSSTPAATLAATSPSVTATPFPTAESTASIVTSGPIAAAGSIAVLSRDASLSIVDSGGRSVALSTDADGNFGFPTWSPDGSRIAAVRSSGTEASLVVFDAAAALEERPAEPVVIFSKPAVEPFYLYWTPDGQAVSFLASEAGGLSLRIAPADGSAPLDGSGPGSIVRSGNPFYYDWIARDRLVAHIGVGPEAVLGEIGLDGKAAGPALGSPADFRSAVVSPDRKSIGFVLDAETGADQVVVARRDGSGRREMDVFGTAAVAFSPSSDSVASIGPVEPGAPIGFPLGPLRLIDVASGKVRTLVEGAIVSFWWSPDGKTIAALRVREAAAASPSVDPSAAAEESPARLLFVDVATGKILSQPAVRPAPTFINGVLAYFDQYALSHQVWAPDGASVLLPELGDDGSTHLTVRFATGEPPVELQGEIGFWSPLARLAPG